MPFEPRKTPKNGNHSQYSAFNFHEINLLNFLGERKSSSRWREEKAYKDLLLLLDWNRPDLAKSEIFQSRDFSRIKVCYCYLFHQLKLLKLVM